MVVAPVRLNSTELAILRDKRIVHIVLDHNKPDMALGQIQLVRQTWGPYLRDLKVVYAVNGPAKYPETQADQVVRRKPLPNHVGVTDLVASSVEAVLSQYPETDYIGCASADAWMLNPNAFMSSLSKFVGGDKPVDLVTTYCGGIGIKGVKEYPDYYLRNLNTFVNCFGGTALMTEFFMMSQSFAKHFTQWNDTNAGQHCYASFHNDKRTEKYRQEGRGLVETHFRWMASQAMGNLFNSHIGLIQPEIPRLHGKYPYVIPSEPFIYPYGVGYTSAHDDNVRAHNVRMFEDNLDMSKVPKVAEFLNK